MRRYRESAPSAVLKLASALRAGLGISRLVDVTRMDRLGLPVWMAVRPRARGLHVHAGKGFRHVDARVGALMEAVEYATAEQFSAGPPTRRMSLEEVARGLPPGCTPAHFAPILERWVAPSTCVAVEEVDRLGTRSSCWVPRELLEVAPPEDREGDHAIFGWTTTGLASGTGVDEATLHALLEVLERDAVAMNDARDESALIRAESLPASLRSLSRAWLGSGIRLVVRSVPGAVGLPCFTAFIDDLGDRFFGTGYGSGLHPDARVALARAVTEAAQSRLSCIHGGRDDMIRYFGPGAAAAADRDDLARREAMVTDARRVADFGDVASWRPKGASPADVLAALVERVQAAGFPAVLRREMRVPVPPRSPAKAISVARVLVPGCEHPPDGEHRSGPRLMQRVLGRA